MSVQFGADRLSKRPALLGNVRRVALATNDAARSAADASVRTRARLLAAGVPIVRLFAPEHGLSADVADGAAVADGTDTLTGLPVTSLYGKQLAPPPALLADLDAVLFDIPDVGARFYTYTWTLTHLVDACADARIPLFVLDRPNPLGGALQSAEGPLLDPACASFIGRHTIPIRHSLTLGEIARLWRGERRPDADVRVIECTGWQRHLLWPETGLPFVPTSPAIASFEAALLYPGLCLFEATNLSVARGTPLSFQAVGAPWLRAAEVAAHFRSFALAGTDVAETEFVQAIGRDAGQRCHAVRLECTNNRTFRPVRAGLGLLAAVIATHRDQFRWANYPTAANPAGAEHFERLIGARGVREELTERTEAISTGTLDEWTALSGWAERWRKATLYG